MKCIKSVISNQSIIRVNDDEAQKMVNSGNWIFVPKKEWKTTVRDVNKKKEPKKEEKKKEKKVVNEKETKKLEHIDNKWPRKKRNKNK